MWKSIKKKKPDQLLLCCVTFHFFSRLIIFVKNNNMKKITVAMLIGLLALILLNTSTTLRSIPSIPMIIMFFFGYLVSAFQTGSSVFLERKKLETDLFEDDFTEYEFAKQVFEQEEGRAPNMNNPNDSNAVAMLEIGIRHCNNGKAKAKAKLAKKLYKEEDAAARVLDTLFPYTNDATYNEIQYMKRQSYMDKMKDLAQQKLNKDKNATRN